MAYYVGLDVGGTFPGWLCGGGNLRFAKAPTTKDDFNNGMMVNKRRLRHCLKSLNHVEFFLKKNC